MKTDTKATLVESQSVTRDYGFQGTIAIIDHPSHGRILIEDGFGGMDSIEGGCVRWKHGAAYQLQPADTLEALQEEEWDESCGDTVSVLRAVTEQVDASRPFLPWSGLVIASLAKSLGL